MNVAAAVRRPRILVVVRDVNERLLCERALRDLLGAVVVVHVGAAGEFAAALDGARPCAVVAEAPLPWLDGFDVVERLHARWPGAPIVVVADDAGGAWTEGAPRDAVSQVVPKTPDWCVRAAEAVRAALDPCSGIDAADADRALIARVPAAIHRASPEGDVVEANAAWRRMFAVADEDSTADFRVLDLFVRSEDWVRFVETMRRDDEVRDFEFEALRRDGAKFWARIGGRAFRDRSGETLFHDCVVEDVSARRRAEDELRRVHAKLLQAQKLDAVGRLASGIAHDFNNIVTAIHGYADLARNAVRRRAPALVYIDEIRECADHAAALTIQLLAFGREQALRPRVVDLNAVLRDLGRLLRRVIPEDVELALELSNGPAPVGVDVGQIEQVVVNLAVNARDAMPHGGRLVVSTSEKDLDGGDAARRPGLAPGRHVVLAVADTGVGMDEAMLAHVFEPYFTTKPKQGGVGLGLATVFGIVEQSRGHIEVESAPGRGSTFRIFLPRAAGGVEGASKRGDGSPSPVGNETVLVVEDDDRLRFIMEQILKDAGYEVLVARGADDAAAEIEEIGKSPALLVADVVLPESSGPEIAARLAAAGRVMRTLFVSGYEDAALARRGVIAKGTPYLAKPFTAEGLLRKVREVLDAPPRA